MKMLCIYIYFLYFYALHCLRQVRSFSSQRTNIFSLFFLTLQKFLLSLGLENLVLKRMYNHTLQEHFENVFVYVNNVFYAYNSI